MKSRIRRWLTVLAAILAATVAPALAQPSAPDPVEARAFEIHYQPLIDATYVVSPLLSDDGELALRPRLSTLVVEDRRSVLDRVEALLAEEEEG